ncbi:MAG: hypothetical protein KAQ94_05125 [Arcobacteraceae bacterium]|nr:hypothetical protein [Arcobacteraceae bacterium]
MNIYIYGRESFKKEISKVLAKDSIKDKLNEVAELNELFGKIIEVDTAEELKNIIELNSDSIFLIDSQRLIDNNFLTKYLKFLNPKDGIEKDFLEQHEIAIKVELDDVASIAQYILNRLETYNINEITKINEMREDDIVSALSQIHEKEI